MHPSYPAWWEADVVLRDGRTAHLRPIRPEDADQLVSFYERVSEESKYFRFFAPHPRLSERDLERFTSVDYVDRVALVALVGDEIISVGRYDRIAPRDAAGAAGAAGAADAAGTADGRAAEVAFLIQDAHQGRGLGSVLLEHLAAAARERGIARFVAEVLPANRKMMAVFRDAGWPVHTAMDEGVVMLEFDLAETETSLSVRQSREHRAEALSTDRLLHPSSIVLIGASRRPQSLGQTVLRNLRAAGFPGSLAAVHPEVDEIAGVPAYRSVLDVPGDIDLAVVAVPAESVEQVVSDCAAKSVRALVVLSAGFAETGDTGRARQERLVHLAHANGMRVVGPSSFGLINTDPDLRLNASLAPELPERGRLGVFAQSGALAVALLAEAQRRGVGVSTFVSAGNRADVSGNDLLQYWEDDSDTDAVLLYLESVGNPRKFSRLARRLGRRKPVIAVKSGRASQGAPLGHAVRASSAPTAAVDTMFRQAGVLRVESISQLFDVARVLLDQPLPAGPRVAVVSNSHALGLLAVDAATELGLTVVGEPTALEAEASVADFERALVAAVEDPGVDSVVAVFIPPLMVADEEVATAVVAAASSSAAKTVVATFLGMRGAELLAAEPGSRSRGSGAEVVPAYPSPEEAVRALATVTRYAEWLRRPQGRVPDLDGIDAIRARLLVDKLLADVEESRDLGDAQTAELLACYGIETWPGEVVTSPDEAVQAAERLGYPVVLKATLPHLRHRPELGQVRIDLENAGQLRGAYAGMVDAIGPAAIGHLVVQHQAPPGVAVVVGSLEDPLFGPIVSFGLGGLATELLSDRAYGIPPLTDVDVAELVRSTRAAPLLFGHRGARPADVDAIEELLLRLSRLADDLPEVARLELNPVLVGERGLVTLGTRARLARPLVRTDRGPRALLR